MHRNRHYIWWWSQFAAARAAQLVHSADITACTRCTAVHGEGCWGGFKIPTAQRWVHILYCLTTANVSALLQLSQSASQTFSAWPGVWGAWSHNAVTEPDEADRVASFNLDKVFTPLAVWVLVTCVIRAVPDVWVWVWSAAPGWADLLHHKYWKSWLVTGASEWRLTSQGWW